MAEHTAESGLLAAYVAAFGAPEKHQRETGEWSGVPVCAEDGDRWPCRLARALPTRVNPPGAIHAPGCNIEHSDAGGCRYVPPPAPTAEAKEMEE